MTVQKQTTSNYLKDRHRMGALLAVIVAIVLAFLNPALTRAATTPSLGAATSYGVLASTYTNTSPSTVNGDVGFTTGPAVAPGGVHTNYGSGGPYATAGSDQASALVNLNGQSCDFNFGAAVDLSSLTQPLAPGVYCSVGAMSVTTSLTLSGGGTYIFRAVGALNTAAGASVILAGGASACDIFWTPTGATTLGANTSFVGTVIDDAGITVGANTTWAGRALAFGGTVTTDTTTITVPTCAAPVLRVVKQVVNNNGGTAVTSGFTMHVKLAGVDVAGSPAAGAGSPGTAYSLAPGTYNVSEDINAQYGTSFSGDCDAGGNVTLALGEDKTCTITNDDLAASINVVKTVVNDNGRTNVVGDFPLFVSGTPVTSGATNTFAPGVYAITETINPDYTPTFSGDCDAGGSLNLAPGDNKFCIITNDDIAPPVVVPPVPPLIEVVKVPSPLTLPSGPGLVTYTFTLRNIGTVTATNITMIDDSCSPLTLNSGDTNANAQLEVSETWTYTCTTTLSQTHTNNVVATGLANGITAVDIASATVVVGLPTVPPLIHVTKVPNPLTLLFGGGVVTYTEVITNPGTVPLSNVSLVDDKCSPLTFISGDTNNDTNLDPGEAWTYTCSTTLTQTTTNTAVASGSANGLTARDFAIATVVVASGVPGFPNTGRSH
jgi:uncharacterized repeat protein (TIGR01451 family)